MPKFEDAQARAFIFSIWWPQHQMHSRSRSRNHIPSPSSSSSHSHSTAMGDSHVRKDIPRLITLARRDVGSARAQLGLDRLYYNTIGSLWLRQSLFPRPRPSPTCLLLLQQRNLWHATRICICISAWLPVAVAVAIAATASLHLISHVIYCCPNLSRAQQQQQ